MERFKIIPSVYLIIIKNGKILLSRRFQTGFEDGNYSLVAGHADGEETMREALSREVLEEIAININPLNFNHVLTMHRWCGDHERIDLFFSVDEWEGEIKNMEPNKCDDLSWFSINQLPQNIIPYIKKAIESYSNGIKYCEFGWEEKCGK
ncbi:MAG: NUDIX domain-containing protein [Candidatus Paceibacterota bacterium]|jgi:ADP-ribose pyrophosphatase YjhB (NUDIX family)